jgi:cellulose synthase/poly-beta-1,6-N-acetylglucosamine synthase-like glycosyltransferase
MVHEPEHVVSCILTAYKEFRTVGRAIEALLEQDWPYEYEILVVCPDEATAAVVQTYMKISPRVFLLTDEEKGKPAALNLAFGQVRGDICLFTDGDVEIQQGAIEPLLTPFLDPNCGAVTARPVSGSPRSTMLGFWSHLLTDAGAHQARLRLAKEQKYLDCSGYLYAARRCLLSPLPEEVLADDAYISHMIWLQGYTIAYAPSSCVKVRYPTNYRDWLLQKVRSTAGATATAALYTKSREHREKTADNREATRMRSFYKEMKEGLLPALTYPRTIREKWWTCCLFVARLYLWIRVWLEIHVKHRSYREVWQRVESTKIPANTGDL